MHKRICVLLILLFILGGFPRPVLAEILVEDAVSVYNQSLEIPSTLPEISSRIIVEYSTSIFDEVLSFPSDLVVGSEYVPERIVIEYATSTSNKNLIPFDSDGDGEPDYIDDDDDGDGMPDDWEKQIIDSDPNDDISNILDVFPGDDFDGDGLINIDELKNHTNPLITETNGVPDIHVGLAKHYSPVIYQHVDTDFIDINGEDGWADLITKFDYDDTWSGDVKWDNLSNRNIGPASVYFSVVESTNFWFLYYAVYHPRDWAKWPDSDYFEHENDMEALTLMIQKGEGYPGNAVAAMSMSHNVWLEYSYDPSVVPLNYDGNGNNLILDNYIQSKSVDNFISNGFHPRIYIQSRGHGIFMDDNDDLCLNFGNSMGINRWNETGFPKFSDYNGTGIVYYCDSEDEGYVMENIGDKLIDSGGLESGPADIYSGKWTKYRLVPVKELWEKRNWIVKNESGNEWTFFVDSDGNDVFYGPGPGEVVSIEEGKDRSQARPPWSMPAQRRFEPGIIDSLCPPDGSVSSMGEIFIDPLSAFTLHFAGISTSNENYIYNDYLVPTRPKLTEPQNGSIDVNPVSVTLKWNRSVHADDTTFQYVIKIKKVISEDLSEDFYTKEASMNETSLPLGDLLDPLTEYEWSVKAVDEEGNEIVSGWWKFSTGKDALPPIGETATNLVFITHGYQSNSSVWSDDMKNAILDHIINKGQGYENEWDIVAYDWKDKAATFAPIDAYINAAEIGEKIGLDIVNREYEHIHFIAHSAGSKLIQTATDTIRGWNATVSIQSTFLDAYYPIIYPKSYGANATWSDNYVDTRSLGGEWTDILDPTDAYFCDAYNYDVTAFDPDISSGIIEPHSWPYRYYLQSIAGSSTGFSLSYEYVYPNYGLWQQTIDTKPIGNDCVGDHDPEYEVIESWGDIVELSDTEIIVGPWGNFSQTTPIMFTLSSGSPAYASMTVELTEGVNHLKFDYEFKSGAEGLLTVFIDGDQVFQIDEKTVLSGMHSTDSIWLRNISPGSHILSFRIDPFEGEQSVIAISNIQFGNIVAIRISDIDKDGDVDGEDVAEFINRLGAGTNIITLEEFVAEFGN